MARIHARVGHVLLRACAELALATRVQVASTGVPFDLRASSSSVVHIERVPAQPRPVAATVLVMGICHISFNRHEFSFFASLDNVQRAHVPWHRLRACGPRCVHQLVRNEFSSRRLSLCDIQRSTVTGSDSDTISEPRQSSELHCTVRLARCYRRHEEGRRRP